MASLLRYRNKDETIKMINRKVALRGFRDSMGNLERMADRENSHEKKLDLNNFMKNPQLIYSKKNVQELDMKLQEVGQLQREYIDDIGVNERIKDAPTNDIESIKIANAKALEYDNMLSPDPSLVSDTKNLEELVAMRKKKMRDVRRRMRVR